MASGVGMTLMCMDQKRILLDSALSTIERLFTKLATPLKILDQKVIQDCRVLSIRDDIDHLSVT